MNTINFKGKPYVMVNERIKYFRENFPAWSLESEITYFENGMIVIKATIKDENRRTIATGHAFEKESSSYINKTSYVENCETSAWGRALGCLNIGIDTSVASYEEIVTAVLEQEDRKPVVETENDELANETKTAFRELRRLTTGSNTQTYKLLDITEDEITRIFRSDNKSALTDLLATINDKTKEAIKKNNG